MTLRLFTLDDHPDQIAVSKIDSFVVGGAFFLDFSRPIQVHEKFRVLNRWFAVAVALRVPVIHEHEVQGGYVVLVDRSEPCFENLQKLWKARYPSSRSPPTAVAGGLKIIADFANQFPEDSKPPSRAPRCTDRGSADQVGQYAISRLWTHNGDLTKGFTGDFIESEAENMMQEVLRMAASPDPLLANRKRLATEVMEYARFEVLSIDPAPAPDIAGLRGQPGITGELKAHLLALLQKDETLRRGYAEPSSWKDAEVIVRSRYAIAYARAHVFHELRYAFDDFDPPARGRDWFRPFVAAVCAWHEHSYRRILGLPHSLPGSDSDANLAAIFLSVFFECVTGGHQFPDVEWRRRVQSEPRTTDLPALRF